MSVDLNGSGNRAKKAADGFGTDPVLKISQQSESRSGDGGPNGNSNSDAVAAPPSARAASQRTQSSEEQPHGPLGTALALPNLLQETSDNGGTLRVRNTSNKAANGEATNLIYPNHHRNLRMPGT
jgi:hypothetical protein